MTVSRDRIARWIFVVAAVYGFLCLAPQYFMEDRIARDFPPPLNHPEHFYGFIGVALVWQIAFLLIASDVRRYRLFMIPAALEKVSFGAAVLVLFAQGRVPSLLVIFGGIDLVLAVLFVLSFRLTRDAADSR